MKIGIIGAGRVGTAFALALSGRGADISGVCSKSNQSVDFVSQKLGKAFINDFTQTIINADLVLMTVPDSVIADFAVKIHEDCAYANISGKIFLHCSGALTSEALEPLSKAGGYVGSLHPIQTFAGKENSWKGMYGIYFGYEGSKEAGEKALQLVNILNGRLLEIKSEVKPLYHAAACVLSNYTVTLSYVCSMLLDAGGIGKDIGIKAFMPLLKNTVENISAEGSLNALTGPIARGDSITVAGHLNAMESRSDNFSELYKVLGRITVQLAIEKGSIDKDRVRQLMEVLE